MHRFWAPDPVMWEGHRRRPKVTDEQTPGTLVPDSWKLGVLIWLWRREDARKSCLSLFLSPPGWALYASECVCCLDVGVQVDTLQELLHQWPPESGPLGGASLSLFWLRPSGCARPPPGPLWQVSRRPRCHVEGHFQARWGPDPACPGSGWKPPFFFYFYFIIYYYYFFIILALLTE